ncbi:MAG: serine protein kinase RIO [Methanomassiliicoccales archaeon]
MRHPTEEELLRALEPYQKRIKGYEDRKVYDQFFDKRTLLSLYELMNDGIIETVDFPISTGKEGGVFKGTAPDRHALAVKIYRITNADFRSIWQYVAADERFRNMSRNFTRLIHAWVQREYTNLQRLKECGLPVPRPLAKSGNVLAMEYIGDEEGPAPLLKDYDATAQELAAFYAQVVDFMRHAYNDAQLVHADLSQYNLMVHKGMLYVIDCSQSMSTRHPNALEFLMRDIMNVNRYFSSKRVNVIEKKELLIQITGGVDAVSAHSS